MGKILTVYYSRTGNNRKVAEKIRELLNCDVEEIRDKKERMGVIGYLYGGRDALRGLPAEIADCEKDPAEYDLVILSGPVWAGSLTPALRAYLQKYGRLLKKTAFVATMGNAGDKKFLQTMEELSARPEASLTLLVREIGKETGNRKIQDFVNLLKQ